MNTHPLNRTKAISHTRVTTLVANDSPFMLKILTQILEAAGDFDLVGTATNGRQALRSVSMLSPDLVLMDIHMPGLNGIQFTRSIKQSEHPPVVILTSSDDSSVTKTTAEEAGADGFVIKQGNIQHRLIGALQDLFGLNGARRVKSRNPVNETRRSPNMASENGLGNFATHERSDSASGVIAIQATDPAKGTATYGKPSLGSAQRPQARCPHRNQHTAGRSLREPGVGTRQPLRQLCASSRIQPARKAGAKTYDTMKKRKQGNPTPGKTKKTSGVPPTIEEIRQRAHEIFVSHGGTPGNELDDWLRAEHELKQQRAGTNKDTT